MKKSFATISWSILALHTLSAAPKIHGELKQWHKVTLDFSGPKTSEKATPNPFTDYRLDVTFTNGEEKFLVPGYFAADGNSANTGATSGSTWRVHFAPNQTGEWKYEARFISGENVHALENGAPGKSAGHFDGDSGTFTIAPTDKTGRDFRAHGRLSYVGKHHLQFEGSKKFFLKAGADAPENFLAYAEFDGDFKTDGHKDQFIKTWQPHVQDWREGDPTWAGGKGKGIIGAVNYLADQGLNVFSFLTMNIDGDDRNVFPYIGYRDYLRLDCSRLDQWETLFAHGTKRGMYLHFKTQECENVNTLDDGQVGPQRKLYYRELIARFGHHLALNWNLGEEIGYTVPVSFEKKMAWARYFEKNDPYQHHIVIHNGNKHYDMMGPDSPLTGFSLQTSQVDFRNVHGSTLNYLNRSVKAGKPWVVAIDEPGDATHSLVPDAEDPTRNDARQNALWGNLLAGGAGIEWYFGYAHAHSDLTCQDYRVREKMWKQSGLALRFFEEQKIPFWDMKNANGLLSSKDGYVLADPGQLYLVFLKKGQPATLDLTGASGPFELHWFNPRDGGPLQTGSTQVAIGGSKAPLGAPPTDLGQDWLIVLRPGDPNRNYPPGVTPGTNQQAMLARGSKPVTLALSGSIHDDQKGGSSLTSTWKASGPGEVKFTNASSPATEATFSKPGNYLLTLTANDGSNTSKGSLEVTVEDFQARVTRTIPATDSLYREGERVIASNELKVENKRRVSFLRFDLKGLPEKILKMELRLKTSSDSGNGMLTVKRGSHTNWNRDQANPKLPYGSQEISVTKVNAISGQPFTVPVTSLVQGNFKDGSHTLVLSLGGGGNDFSFHSTASDSPPELLITFEDEDGEYENFGKGKTAKKSSPVLKSTSDSEIEPFKFNYDVKKAVKIHEQKDGIIVVEAEEYDFVDRQFHRNWEFTSTDETPDVQPDPDPNHAAGALGRGYLELLPDTRVTHADPLVNGVSFTNTPGARSVLYYPVEFFEIGRYYVWVRMNCTGSEDNGIHVGIDGVWPDSGQRMQFTGQHGKWQWDSRQRTEKVHTGVLGQIWLDVDQPGVHTIMFSMREDGFEFDRFLLTKEKDALKSKNSDPGPAASPKR